MVSTNNGGGLSAADVAAVMGGANNGWGLGGDGAWRLRRFWRYDGHGNDGWHDAVSLDEPG